MCFESTAKGRACLRCGALIAPGYEERHLEFHHPDPIPGVAVAGWKNGIPPNWARGQRA